MRVLFELLVLFGGVAGITFLIDRYVRNRSRLKKMPVAYFSGGPLTGQNHKRQQLPLTITYEDHIYRKEALSSDSRAAVYMYVGMLNEPDKLSQEQL